MCGIAGFVGESKDMAASYELLTGMFANSEIRGVDASGFWGVEPDGSVVYHKEPTRSSVFVRKPAWRELAGRKFDLMIVHARGASSGVGLPAENQNNHPFASPDRSVALVHNGRVDDCEYGVLRQKYMVNSDCDSEILLRILLSREGRLDGISDIFSLINHGHMAVAVGERKDERSRVLHLFRNQHRPLWVIDLRDKLGQVFFVSEPGIWHDALFGCQSAKGLIKSAKVIEVPPEQIWVVESDQRSRSGPKVVKYEVERGDSLAWESDGQEVPVKTSEANFAVKTLLGDDDRVTAQSGCHPTLRVDSLNHACDTLIDTVNNIRQSAELMAQGGSISQGEFEQILDELDQKRREMEDLCAVIQR